jgi:hypothetical protein
MAAGRLDVRDHRWDIVYAVALFGPRRESDRWGTAKRAGLRINELRDQVKRLGNDDHKERKLRLMIAGCYFREGG